MTDKFNSRLRAAFGWKPLSKAQDEILSEAMRLSEQLEAERQRADVAEKYAASLNQIIDSRDDELREVERERDEAIMTRLEVSEGLSIATRRYEAAESELARRDAAAGEPVAFTHESEISNMHATGLYIRGFPTDRRLNSEEGYTVALYAAAQPAILPPKKKEQPEPEDGWQIDYMSPNDAFELGYAQGYNQHHDDAISLGAQPQKVVELPKLPERIEGYYPFTLGDVINAIRNMDTEVLNAAGVKWKDEK